MIVNKALMAAAVLLFTAPVVPALAHDEYGEHWGLHRDLSEAHYMRCLGCPEDWHDNYGWRRYWRPHYYGGWRYGGWPYGGWRYGGWRYSGRGY